MALFDAKQFNAAVFNKYTETVADLNKNELIKSGILNDRSSELKAMFADQVGGNYQTVPIYGIIGGDPVNYDGGTNITSGSRTTYAQKMIVVGRARGWVEKDFASDITGGVNFMPVATETEKYWQDYYQKVMLSSLKGVFSMTGGANGTFVTKHTTDLTGASTKTFDATTLNTAIQKACGDNKRIFSVAVMHSVVATALENLQLLQYFKATDSNGLQRDIGLATLNGKTVLVDDNMPTSDFTSTAGVYTLEIKTAAAVGDELTLFGTKYTFVADNTGSPTATQIKVGATPTATEQAANIQAKLAAIASGTPSKYTFAAEGAVVTMTMKVDQESIIPVVTASVPEDDTIKIEFKATASPELSTKYVTYVLGKGAFDYGDFGATVPSEMARDAATNGGQTTLYTRKRKMYAPHGLSFEPESVPASPTLAQLETGENWTLVHDGQSTKAYINHREIPIARIITIG